MTVHICVTCGTSFASSPAPPDACPICRDERQYVPATGQAWTTQAKLAGQHANAWRRREPALWEIETAPRFGIGQRAFLLRTPAGNVLWDCIALLDDATRAIVEALGGIAAIAISHPHYYTTMQDWAEAFEAPVYLHSRDREWVQRPSPRLVFWKEDRRELLSGTTLIRLGGHFPGGTVLHWPGGGEDGGALMAGDILQVGADRRSVSFMWSFPNNLPLSAAMVARIAESLQGWPFRRIYGAFGHHVLEDGDAVAQSSAKRYQELLATEQA